MSEKKPVKIPIGLLCTLIAAGCNQFRPLQGLNDIRPGATTLNEALQILENPLRVTSVHDRPSAQIYHWEEFSLQSENKLVTAVFRPPTGEEKSFLYWRHAYRTVPHDLKKLADQNLWQLTVPTEGLAVIYDEDLDQVTKVVRYETP